jgi:hypothetical protein
MQSDIVGVATPDNRSHHALAAATAGLECDIGKCRDNY